MTSLSAVRSKPGILPGTVIKSTAASPPTQTLACDGTAVSRTTYAALFAVVGTTWGVGDGSTTFNLPDFRAAFLIGSGSQVLSAKTFSGSTIGTKQNDATAKNGLSLGYSASTSISLNATDLAHTHNYTERDMWIGQAFGDSPSLNYATLGGTETTDTTSSVSLAHVHTLTVATTTTPTITGQTETVPFHAVVSFYIAY